MKKRNILIILAIIFILAIIIAIIIFFIFRANNSKTFSNENLIEKNIMLDENKIEESDNKDTSNDINNLNFTSNSDFSIGDDSNSNSTSNSDFSNVNDSHSNSSSNSYNSSGTISSNKSNLPSTSVQPTHVHDWKDHTAQRWVSNIVTVVDTPAQTISGAQLYKLHSDGNWYSDGEIYWFENGFTSDDLKDILKDKIKNEGYIGNYVNRTKTIPAVTHEEDQGHYETYVDYQYCECGARREV